MERVRIRSMLNTFKSHHLSNSARTTPEGHMQHLTLQYAINPNQQKNKIHHSCFILDPAIGLTDKEDQGSDQEDPQKSSYLTTKQAPKRRTKIANKSYMMTLPVKTKEASQNLKELGIKIKKINERKEKEFKSTEKLCILHNFGEASLKNQKNTSEKFQKRSMKRRSDRKKSVPDTWRHPLELKVDQNSPKTLLVPWKKTKQIGYNIRSFKFVKVPRKSSDICPWEFESTNILA